MYYFILIFVLLVSGVLQTSARPQDPQVCQYNIPCPVTYPVPGGRQCQTPTLNLVIRTEGCQNNEPPAPAPKPPAPNPPCHPLLPCPPPFLPFPPGPPPRRLFTSMGAFPGAVMDSILSGEVTF